MGELNGILSKLDELKVLIISIAEVLSVTLICLVGLRVHYEKFRRKPKRRDRERGKGNKAS